MPILVIQTATNAAVGYLFSAVYFQSNMSELLYIYLSVRLSETPLIGKPAYTTYF